MKSKLIIVLVVGLISVGALGCANAKEDIVVKEDVTTEVAEKEKKIVVEEISNPENYKLGNLVLSGNEVYGVENFYDTQEDVKKTLYKITDDNKFEKSENQDVINKMVTEGIDTGLVFDLSENREEIKGIKYEDRVSGEETKIFEFEEVISRGNEDFMPSVKSINNDYGFFAIDNGKENITEELEILNVKTKERIKVEGELKGEVKDVIYDDAFYVVTSDLKIHKLKDEKTKFTIEGTIDLGEGENVAANSVESNGDEIVIIGTKTVAGKKPDTENEVFSTLQSFIVKYNLKTKEKEYIAANENEEILNAKGNIVLFHKYIKHAPLAVSDYFVGEIVNGKIKTIGELDLREGKEVNVGVLSCFNEDASEIMLRVSTSDSADTFEYMRVKIQ
ncbi:MAG: hypothetical protein ACRC6T_11165 [Sarcina sp.]